MKRSQGFTVWLTGLPGAGKSTLAKLLDDHLRQLGLPVALLDGDDVRKRLSKGLGFTREDREENIRRIAYVAKLISGVGGVTIVAAIAPYAQSREEARGEIEKFIEVFVKCPLQICVERDPKACMQRRNEGRLHTSRAFPIPMKNPRILRLLSKPTRNSPRKAL